MNTPGGVGITAVARLWACFQPGLVGRPLPPAVPARERERHSVMRTAGEIPQLDGRPQPHRGSEAAVLVGSAGCGFSQRHQRWC